MPDVLANGIAAPVPVTIAGRECKLSYPMHAAIVYRQETARIERSRPQPEDPDPRCACGARQSEHKGAGQIRLSEKLELLCPRFRREDSLQGDSLFNFENWLKIDLASDPERWTVCLWAGMHELQADKRTWKAPFTLEELQASLGIRAETRAIDEKMREAMSAWWPKPKPKKVPDPNAQAAPEENPAPRGRTDEEATTASTTNSGSTLAPAGDLASAAPSS